MQIHENLTMKISKTGTVTELYRYPVKGLTGEPLNSATLSVGATLPFDRAYAIENGPGPFDPTAPAHLPKIHFVMLMRNEQLAGLRSTFDDTNHTLTIRKDGQVAAEGDLRSSTGRAVIESFITQYFGSLLRGPPRVVSAPGHSFSDVAAKCLHIVNLESVRALETLYGLTIDPLRFRPNIIIDGLSPWREFDLIGKTLRVGDATLEVFKRTERCAATNVDPATGVRDMKIPGFLSRMLGHTDFGVYARVITGGRVQPGDAVSV